MDDEDDERCPELIVPLLQKKKIPVTIVCGFLGSGKSSLIATLVSETSQRIAVVLNELGETRGLESVIAAGGGVSSSSSSVIELRNGCVCCSVKDELAQSLEELARKVEPDAIAVELSGVANPCPVAASFWLDDALESQIELDCVVCVVDALNASKTLQIFEASRQLACADRIVVSKVDLCSPNIDIFESSMVETRRAVKGAGLSSWILNTGAYGKNAAKEARKSLETPGAFAAVHATNFDTVLLEQQQQLLLDPAKLQTFLAQWLWHDDDENLSPGSSSHERMKNASEESSSILFRVKGIVRLDAPLERDDDVFSDDAAYSYVLQGVYDLFELTPLEQPVEGGGFVLLIGVNLPRQQLEDDFARCFSSRTTTIV